MIRNLVKEAIADLLVGDCESRPMDTGSHLTSSFVGKYVLVRSRNEGINAGVVVAADASGVIIKDARRLWYHKPTKASWYEGVAANGMHSDSKASGEASQKCIVEDYSLTLCSEESERSIRNAPVHNS